MAYPTEVLFTRAEPGAGGVRVTWEAPVAVAVVEYTLYRSDQDIAPEQTARFYEGAFVDSVTRSVLAPDQESAVDRPATCAAWYLVQARDAAANLHAVAISVAALDAEESMYDSPPRLVFRDDDKAAEVSTRMMASSLAKNVEGS